MVRHTDARGLKADAFALSKALSAYRVKLSHQQCLDVLAKMGGSKSYEALSSGLNGSGGVVEFPAGGEAMFSAMRLRIERWARERGEGMVPPARLMARTSDAWEGLKEKVHQALGMLGGESGSLVLTMTDTACDVLGVRALSNTYGGQGPVVDKAMVDVCVDVDQTDLVDVDALSSRLSLSLYRRLLEEVERIAKGYVVAMEAFTVGGVKLDFKDGGEWDIVWRFYEANTCGAGLGEDHPMVDCGDHMICASDISIGLVNEAVTEVHLVVGLWHFQTGACVVGERGGKNRLENHKYWTGRAKAFMVDMKDRHTKRCSWNHRCVMLEEWDVDGLGELLSAMRKACDGAVLMAVNIAGGDWNVDLPKIEGGKVLVRLRSNYDISMARVNLDEGSTAELHQVIAKGVERGLVVVRQEDEEGVRSDVFAPSSAFRNGFAIQMAMK